MWLVMSGVLEESVKAHPGYIQGLQYTTVLQLFHLSAWNLFTKPVCLWLERWTCSLQTTCANLWQMLKPDSYQVRPWKLSGKDKAGEMTEGVFRDYEQ